MNCEILTDNGPINISQLTSDIYIENSLNEVEILNHVGSCIVNSSNNISVIMALPDSGNCVLSTSFGNITLKIPMQTNSKVDLFCDDGVITVEEFNFTQFEQNLKSVSSILGIGSGKIYLHSQKGNIFLQKF